MLMEFGARIERQTLGLSVEQAWRRRSPTPFVRGSQHDTVRRSEFFSATLSPLFTRVAATEALHTSITLFSCRISDGHALCMNAAMLRILHRLKMLRRPAASMEPPPTFTSDAEIELAARLRHQLEQQYFEPGAAPPSRKNRSGKND
ncbi:MAG TPA: hypothetical protein VLU54_18160 [Casimicrobiaceae bacterium]|nr:hypothetical protein [Casimicrobiaceae bacterium]